MKNKIKVYFVEVVSDEKVNMICVDLNDRHKIWLSHPNAKEISGKEYYQLKDEYNDRRNRNMEANSGI